MTMKMKKITMMKKRMIKVHLVLTHFRIYSELFVTITSRMVVCSSSIIMMVQDPPTKVQQLSQSKDNDGWIGCQLEDKQQIIIVLLNNININRGNGNSFVKSKIESKIESSIVKHVLK